MQIRQTLLIAALAAAAGLAACSSTPVTGSDNAARPAAESAKAAPAAPAAPARAVAAVVVPEHLDPRSAISTGRSVYFGFDDYAVKAGDFPVIERQAAYLRAHPELKVTVEGNTDERGGSEYNLALGQRRAEAVVKALRSQGVKDGQTEPTSWGRDKPKATGHDEAAWAQNRRVDIQYPAH